ncbi:TetR/AcrR family transcriptional regulator [Oryzobacter telluris]|uniref:TetR/AcrR family transcriptional regulator n=1 Tax=Oryzobacter telluris TaxID=3149179 RepID=UPI00370D2A87
MTPTPRTPNARGGRRAELLEAAVEVVAEAGLRGLTHRAVDARAGLPEGTCSAYLRSRSALLVALAEHVAGMLARDVDAMTTAAAEHAGDPEAVAGEVTALLLRWLERPAVVRTQAELSLEAARRPELMEVFQEWRRGLDTVVERLVEDGGHAEPALLATVAVAAIEGVLATATRMPAPSREAFVRASVPVLVRGLHDRG